MIGLIESPDVYLVDFIYSKRIYPRHPVIFSDLDGGISVLCFSIAPVETTEEMI
jgi:hypothetical protein